MMQEDLDLLLLKCQGALKELDNENFENPWEVSDASEFLRYFCPECNHNSRSLDTFSSHALTEHPKSAKLFDKVAEYSAKDHKNMINIFVVISKTWGFFLKTWGLFCKMWGYLRKNLVGTSGDF